MFRGATLPIAAFAFLAVPHAVSAKDGFALRSLLNKFRTAIISELPRGPQPSLEQLGNCEFWIKDPETPAGKHVKAKGWEITSEAVHGDYTFVSFAGKLTSGTSGSCAIEQGNVGVFENGSVRGVIYTGKKSDRLIGSLNVIEGGAVRLWDGDFLRLPVADISVSEFGIEVQSLSSKESLCDGRAVVPNIYGKTIVEARKKLSVADWMPIETVPPENFGEGKALLEMGVKEVNSCSGTGFGYCWYAYTNGAFTLSVQTAGEVFEGSLPEVVAYFSDC